MGQRITLISLAVIGVVGVAIGLLCSGPLFSLVPQVPQVTLPADLDHYLAQAEAAVGTVKPDQQKKIFWADGPGESRTSFAFVYFHGFSASRQDLSPLMEELAAEYHVNLFMTRLSAHGLKDSDERFASLRAQDFITDAHEALAIGQRLGQRVVVVGMSTGALLALHLAAFEAQASSNEGSITAVIALSPNFRPADRRAKIISGRFGPWLAKRLIGDYRSFPTENDAHAEFWTSRYRSEGIVALMDLVNYATGITLSRLRVPVLTIYTRHDEVVDVDLIRTRSAELRAPGSRVVDLDALPRHELAGRALYPMGTPLLKAQIRKFLDELNL